MGSGGNFSRDPGRIGGAGGGELMPAIYTIFMDRAALRLLAGLGIAAFWFGYFLAVS